ncbi:MAG: RNA polymerase sigma factor [Deltaproteobacteria bacterium]|nr:RNA polymerase sigma factor [Deltaproteobacteria bacterium]
MPMTQSLASHIDDTDAALVAHVVAGERDLFGILVQRYNQRLYRACRAILRDDQDAEDAVQGAWIKAYRHLATFRGDAAFPTWLTRIAIREATDRKRVESHLVAVDAIEQVTISDEPTPDRSTFSAELGRLFERRLDELPDGMRSVLLLRDVLELDTAETAHCLGIREEAVRVRLHRARQALADVVDHGLTEAFRFDGARCARIHAAVMAAI